MLASLHLRRRLHLNAGKAGGTRGPGAEVGLRVGQRVRDLICVSGRKPECDARPVLRVPAPGRPGGPARGPQLRSESCVGCWAEARQSPTCGMEEGRVAATGRPGGRPNLALAVGPRNYFLFNGGAVPLSLSATSVGHSI